MAITRIVSGGQTGADQGGWDAAIHCDLPYGGWVPKGRKTEAGTIPSAYTGYKETGSTEYLVRTEANVVDSDVTVVLSFGPPTGGSKKTVELAAKYGKPCLVVDLRQPRKDIVEQIASWLVKVSPADCTLNVAGSRESKSPGIQRAVLVRMVDVISKVNGKLFYPLREEG